MAFLFKSFKLCLAVASSLGHTEVGHGLVFVDCTMALLQLLFAFP
jgi:hypothetical protein